MTSSENVQVPVGFNQQQRQLLDQLKKEGTFGTTHSEVIRAIFVLWLKEEGLL